MDMAQYVKVAKVDDLKPGTGTLAVVNGTRIALFNCDGAIYAIKGSCPHMGGELWEGLLAGDIVTCPWHGWRFNVKTGKNPTTEVVGVRTYDVKVDGGEVYVAV
jgi:3-phenylpropionate/trans-cinnamate dioxygenase ferredoxin component